MEFTDIPIYITGNTHSFDFEYREMTDYGQACFIRSEGREMVIDEDFAVIRNDFPEDWVPAIIDRLKGLLNYGTDEAAFVTPHADRVSAAPSGIRRP